MRKLISFLQQDISLKKTSKPKKLSTKSQRKVIQLFNNLFSSGFHLTEIVDFLERSQLLATKHLSSMREGLLQGQELSGIMAGLGFSDTVVTQLSLAEIHGHTQGSLSKIEAYLEKLLVVKKKLLEVATYPIILLSFLVLIMLGLKNYLLPQLDSGNVATQLISHFPLIFLGIMTVVILSGGVLFLISRRMNPLTLASWGSRLPLVGHYITLYLTAYYAREWGNLMGQGIEMPQIVTLMQKQPSRLFSAVGQDMERSLLAGQEFHQKILDYPFFLKELSLIIEYGQVKAKLGHEMDIYAEEIWEQFFTKIHKATQLIQPLVFILVALVIVLIYAAMLLPIYQNMEVTL